MMSACGVICPECPAYRAAEKSAAHQSRTAEAWRRIYGLGVKPAEISCSGCLGPDDQLFRSSRDCKARRCCLQNGFSSCGECAKTPCEDLERAQSIWDGVPKIAETLSPSDFLTYARAYCGHRERIAAIRRSPNRR